jgi:predicted dehydrogenase
MPQEDHPRQNARQSGLNRRRFLAATSAAVAAGVGHRAAFSADAPPRCYRVAVIGHTGRGNYGHGLDTVWREVPRTQLVAVADADEKGLADAVKRLGGPKGYRDYRQMLDEVKPEIVAVAPRWLDQHRDMVVAAADRGVLGIYMEKPLCPSLADADAMVAACEKHKVKLAIAFQTRYGPRLRVVEELIRAGKLGRVVELRARGKEDGRGGSEDLWVLGTHVLNLVHHFGGDPQWCFGTVLQQGRPIRPDDVRTGAEGIGPLAGDEVHATYRLAGGATAFFDSVRGAGGSPTRFGLRIFGSAGATTMGTGYLPPVYFLPDSSWSPGQTGKKWLPVSSAGVEKPEPLTDSGLHGGNVAAVEDLLDAIEKDRQPAASIYEARTSTEMIAAVFESQRLGVPVKFPLENRQNPLTMLTAPTRRAS